MNCPARYAPPGGVPAKPGPEDAFSHRRVPQGPASSSRSELASPFGSLRSSLMGTPFISLLRVGRASPARTPPPGGVPPSVGPGAAVQTLFTHRRVPQGPASSSRSELDAPSTNLKLEIDSTLLSPRGSRRLPPSARHWLRYGRFLVLFVARDKKYVLPPAAESDKSKKKAGRHSAARQFLFT